MEKIDCDSIETRLITIYMPKDALEKLLEKVDTGWVKLEFEIQNSSRKATSVKAFPYGEKIVGS